jgi:hypothetical protein
MTWFFMRKHQRLTRVVSVRYHLRGGIVGEGIIDGLSLSGSYMTGNRPVSVGMALALEMFVPGDPKPLLIDRATVLWVKGSEFGVDFDTLKPKVAEQITTVISTLVKTQHGSFRYAKERRAGVGRTTFLDRLAAPEPEHPTSLSLPLVCSSLASLIPYSSKRISDTTNTSRL